MANIEDRVYDLIEEIANNHSLWPIEKSMIQIIVGIYEVGVNTALNAKMDMICKNLETLNMKVNGGSTSSPFGGAPESESYKQQEETVNYVNNFIRRGNNPYYNTYNPEWRNHPNFAWSKNSGQMNNPPHEF